MNMEHGQGTRTWTQTWTRTCDLVGSIYEKIRSWKFRDTVSLIKGYGR
jgi:hypothetical protein